MAGGANWNEEKVSLLDGLGISDVFRSTSTWKSPKPTPKHGKKLISMSSWSPEPRRLSKTEVR